MSDSQKINDIIRELFNSNGLNRKLEEAELMASWSNIMGENINKLTSRLYIRNNQLFVKLKSAALKHELSLRKTEILQKFVEYHGKEIIKDIVFLS